MRGCWSQEDPFELFISSTKIRFCYYHETHKILGACGPDRCD